MFAFNLSNIKLFSIVTALLLTNTFLAESASSASNKLNTNKNQQAQTAAIKATKPQTLKAGKYCFKIETKTFSGEARLTVKANKNVTGNIEIGIHDESEGYYTSADQSFTGKLTGNKLKVQVVTKIEYDTQRTQETWTLTKNSLITGQKTFNKVTCSN
ncbi:MAG TPA: hypothetical protein V6D15_24230 [Oculatellaceae cyanobacterium]|jgi:hypothetical protein